MAQDDPLISGVDVILSGRQADDSLSLDARPAIAFIGKPYQQWTEKYWHYSIPLAIAYMALIVIGQHFMKNRKAYDLKSYLTAWNMGLAIYSTLATYHGLPEMVKSLSETGFHGSYCVEGSQFNGDTGFWNWVFVWSKVAELGDTVFLVLRKRPVILLHWYHHALVMVFSFYQYPMSTASARWGLVMNVIVHSVMYTYFALRAIGFAIPKQVSMFVTTIQIIQMLVGSLVCGLVLKNVALGQACDVAMSVAIFQASMYFTFLVMFADLFRKMYLTKGGKKAV